MAAKLSSWLKSRPALILMDDAAAQRFAGHTCQILEAFIASCHFNFDDGQLMEPLKQLVRKSGGEFIPELICDSIGQCVSAVGTGAYAQSCQFSLGSHHLKRIA
jgi:hypothetical protein